MKSGIHTKVVSKILSVKYAQFKKYIWHVYMEFIYYTMNADS